MTVEDIALRENLESIVNKDLYTSHGRVTHPMGDPCEVCEEAKREWLKVKDVIEKAFKEVQEGNIEDYYL